MIEIWLPLALGATLAWGVGQIAAKKGSTVLGPRKMVAIVSLGEAAFFLAFYVGYGAEPLVDFHGALLGIAAGLTGMLGYVIYYEAIARGTISRVGTITAAYPAVTVVLALVILAEAFTPLQGMGVILLLGSAVLLGRAEKRKIGGNATPITLLIILAFLLWGVWGFLVKLAVSRLGEGPIFLYFALANGLIGFILYRRRPRMAHRGRGMRAWAWPAMAMACGASGVILLTLALAVGPASLVTPVTGAYPVVTVLIAGPALLERLGKLEVLAFLTFVLGIFFVALS